eukprot:m51a1_g962 hypothetical protein (434) ;mRNA; f:353929-355864
MDALSLLRKAITSGAPIALEGGDLVLGDGIRFARDTPTAFQSKRGGFYPLSALWYCWIHSKEQPLFRVTEYFTACSARGVKPVSLPDRASLLAYLRGETESCDAIAAAEANAEAETTAAAEEEPQKPAVDESAIIEEKRAMAELLSKPGTRITDLPSVDTERLAGLEGMDRDRILQIKIKRQQRKRQEIDKEGAPEDQSVQSKRFLEADAVVTKRITDREISLRTRESVMRASKRNFARSRSAAREAARAPPPIVGLGGGAGGSAPIIVVPNSLTSLVGLWNVRRFLEDGVWERPEDARAAAASPDKPPYIEVSRVLAKGPQAAGRRPTTFRVVDSAAGFSDADWSLLVAVFAQGATWQFSGWRWPEPAALFDNSCGFFVVHDNEPAPPSVRGWPVTMLRVGRVQRHRDTAACELFWNTLLRWVAAHKPNLRL